MDRPPPPLTGAESAVLAAMLDGLIPADEHGPGAVEARVPVFIERALGAKLAPLRGNYARNLAALEAWTRATRGTAFAALDPGERDAVLGELERGAATGFEPSAQAFFELVRLHAIQGMFADPSHGGNAGYAGWDLIGFPGIKVTFAPAEQLLDVPVEPVRPDER
jgi:gluconate 2-dehydrogenase gamma chain